MHPDMMQRLYYALVKVFKNTLPSQKNQGKVDHFEMQLQRAFQNSINDNCWIAQWLRSLAEEPEVGGSIPPLGLLGRGRTQRSIGPLPALPLEDDYYIRPGDLTDAPCLCLVFLLRRFMSLWSHFVTNSTNTLCYKGKDSSLCYSFIWFIFIRDT